MCDVLLDLPAVYEPALTTIPIYRSTYVLAYRNDRGFDFKGFDDPALKSLKIGVFQTSSIRQVLTKRGLAPEPEAARRSATTPTSIPRTSRGGRCRT